MSRIIDIKRRAQRCIQAGDLDGAIAEYERLIAVDEGDPYHHVLLGDLLYKKNDHAGAADRYLQAATTYERLGLYKNAVAIGKKMLRLALAPASVLETLARLHELDGLRTEAALYFSQYADSLARDNRLTEAAEALRRALECAPDEPRLAERRAELLRRCGRAEETEGVPARPAAATGPPAEIPAPPDTAATAETAPEFAPESRPPWPPRPQAAPGLRFASPMLELPAEPEPPAEADAESAAAEPEVEALLESAEVESRADNDAAAARLLLEAASRLEAGGEGARAAEIYRRMTRGRPPSAQVLARWLENARRRCERAEVAEVLCELGDLAGAEGRLDESRQWFERALESDAGNAVARRRLARLAGGDADPVAAGGGVGTAAPASGRIEVEVPRSEAVSLDLASIVGEFARQVSGGLAGDAQGHYDVAMAYREMGLTDQALESFRRAAAAPEFALRCGEMIGRCLLEADRCDEAAAELGAVLARADAGAEGGDDLRVLHGLALERSGRLHEALGAYERALNGHGDRPELEDRIREVRARLAS